MYQEEPTVSTRNMPLPDPRESCCKRASVADICHGNYDRADKLLDSAINLLIFLDTSRGNIEKCATQKVESLLSEVLATEAKLAELQELLLEIRATIGAPIEG